MDKLQYLHNFSIEEQLEMEIAKINSKYKYVQDYTDLRWLAVLTEEVGEVAKNINTARKIECNKINTQENLEYELLQVMAVCKIWLEILRKNKPEVKNIPADEDV